MCINKLTTSEERNIYIYSVSEREEIGKRQLGKRNHNHFAVWSSFKTDNSKCGRFVSIL